MFSRIFGRSSFSAPPAPEPLPPRYVSSGRIDFHAAGLDEYHGCYAVVLDNLFSQAELTAILAEAEGSAPWEVAQVNAGDYAYTDTSYRNGQRIIYDSFELSQKIFEKVQPYLTDIEEIERPTYPGGEKALQKWRMVRLNERLRFLRYPEGGYFRGHCDGAYHDKKTKQRTFYTLQFYLPSDTSGSNESFVPAQGGSTRFIARYSSSKYADVEAIPGRVLVFQHDDLYHTGEEVTGGVKCTVRSDILYERVGTPKAVEHEEL
ncbi:alcohol dehydrogenase [Favolaschia claudopus]|uniref:Alcohol dehydrogenase n=1 Tax=Favolaschia claudopus TaxID=2862362 RepID=A0AAW0D6H8_9AGAR